VLEVIRTFDDLDIDEIVEIMDEQTKLVIK